MRTFKSPYFWLAAGCSIAIGIALSLLIDNTVISMLAAFAFSFVVSFGLALFAILREAE